MQPISILFLVMSIALWSACESSEECENITFSDGVWIHTDTKEPFSGELDCSRRELDGLHRSKSHFLNGQRIGHWSSELNNVVIQEGDILNDNNRSFIDSASNYLHTNKLELSIWREGSYECLKFTICNPGHVNDINKVNNFIERRIDEIKLNIEAQDAKVDVYENGKWIDWKIYRLKEYQP